MNDHAFELVRYSDYRGRVTRTSAQGSTSSIDCWGLNEHLIGLGELQ